MPDNVTAQRRYIRSRPRVVSAIVTVIGQQILTGAADQFVGTAFADL
jgi:hypothetical protein